MHAASVLARHPLDRGLLGDVLEALTSTHAEGKRGGAGGSAPKATRGQGGQGAGEDEEKKEGIPEFLLKRWQG